MMYGERYDSFVVNMITKEKTPCVRTYKYAEWNEYHVNNDGEGLFIGNRQLLGTCQFSVTGCNTEKSARAKIRNFVKKAYLREEDN